MSRQMGKISTEQPKNFKGSIKRMISYMGGYRWVVLSVWIIAISATVLSVMGPKVMGKATTELAKGLVGKIYGTGEINFSKIGYILVITLCLYVASALLTVVQSIIMTGVTQRICYRMRMDISKKLDVLPMKYFESKSYGDVLSRITNDIDTISMGMNQSITQIITSISTIVGVVVMMLTISPLMTLIALVIVPISFKVLFVILKFSQKYFRSQQDILGKINGNVEENYSGQLVIKAFNREEAALKEFEDINESLYNSTRKAQFWSGLMQPLMIFLGNIGYGAVVISGGVLAMRGTIGIGDIQAFIQYVKSFNQPMQQIAQVINQLQSLGAASERVFEFLDEEEETEIEGAEEKDVKDIKGDILFENVRFGYREDKTVINDFTLRVKRGQKIAIVGPTGAGKTTIVKLLMRFYDINSGAIYLDGRDIKKIKRESLRNSYAMVLQDTWLFNGSIMDNIRYGRLEATDEEVINAAKAAEADHFIRTLPGGYSMKINEEADNISQGEKQLITIARAILADKPLLILDEATSSVDTRTESIIQKAMDKLMHGRTCFVIAHRLSTIKNADIILVMKDGDILEQGSHEELIAMGGFYSELYKSQFDN